MSMNLAAGYDDYDDEFDFDGFEGDDMVPVSKNFVFSVFGALAKHLLPSLIFATMAGAYTLHCWQASRHIIQWACTVKHLMDVIYTEMSLASVSLLVTTALVEY
jgi:hypothetical protein